MENMQSTANPASEIQHRKESFLKFVKQKANYAYGIIFAFIVWFAVYIRTRNLKFLIDATTGKYIPADPDAMGFLRYIKIVAESGSLPALDTLRYYPFGYNPQGEFSLLSHLVYWMYKIIHTFIPSITLEKVHVIYPAVAFIFALIFFYLFVNKLFNKKIALIATAYLAVLPAFLFRTMAGISDKEAFAIVFMFASFYFFIASWKEENFKKAVFFGVLAGLATGLTGLIWGGSSFIFMLFGLFALIEVITNKINKKKFIVYFLWYFFSLLLLAHFYSERYGSLFDFMQSTVMIMSCLALISMVIFFVLRKYFSAASLRHPLGFFSVVYSIIIGIVLLIFKNGFSYIPLKIYDIFIDMTRPFSKDRWALTVAESHQPYFTDWVSNFGWFLLILFCIGLILIFYNLVAELKLKHRIYYAVFYAVCLLGFTLSRYSEASQTFNGQTFFANFIYLGSLIALALVSLLILVYSFYRNKETYDKFCRFDSRLIFTILFAFIMLVAGRSALRLLFVLAPVVVLVVSYLLGFALEKSLLFRNNICKYVGIAILVIIVFAPFSTASWTSLASQSLDTAKHIGPNYDMQWQNAMDWVRKNTPEDAVFAQWWDYGYYIQTGANRATLSDGGNAQPNINHYVGRHVLTANSAEEALTFLKTYSADYLLIVSDEIGKYPAYSSIGADKNYDRYSYIPAFFADENEVRETREGAMYLLRGTFVFDDDFEYDNLLFTKGNSAVIGIILQTKNNANANNSQFTIEQPIAIVYNNGQQVQVPIECMYLNNKLITYEKKGLNGCLRMLPRIKGPNQIDQIGTAFYVSEKVRKTLFAQLYLFEQKIPGFELAYDDTSQGYTLAHYDTYGRMIGPLRIWKINPPSQIKPDPYYLNLSAMPRDLI